MTETLVTFPGRRVAAIEYRIAARQPFLGSIELPDHVPAISTASVGASSGVGVAATSWVEGCVSDGCAYALLAPRQTITTAALMSARICHESFPKRWLDSFWL